MGPIDPPKPKINTTPEPIQPKPTTPETQKTTNWSENASWLLETWHFGASGHAKHIGQKFRNSSGKTLGDLTLRDIN